MRKVKRGSTYERVPFPVQAHTAALFSLWQLQFEISAFHLEALGAIRIAAAFKHGPSGIGKQRPGRDYFPVRFLRSDQQVGRFALFDPIHNYRKPIHVSSPGPPPQ